MSGIKTTLVFVLLVTASALGHVEETDDVESSSDDETVIKVETISPEEDVLYLTPAAHKDVYFAEHFDSDEHFDKKWIRSRAAKDGADEAIAKYDAEWSLEAAAKDALSGDMGLVLKSKAKHAAISAKLKKPFNFKDKPFIIQYELNFQNGQDCGGGYLKLLTHDPSLDLRKVMDKTPYTIMFGPDKCGSDAKLHFIFRHVNPKNQSIEEKHCKKLETKERTIFEEYFKDKRPHLYRLLVRPDNTFEVSVDYKVLNHGSLFEDFTPSVNPPAEIDDPKDEKPKDWDEREKIPDPAAQKPTNWDESQPKTIVDESATMPSGWLEDEEPTVPDPNAERPDDWDDELDGEWEAPQVDNPECKSAPGCGPWKKPVIDNPRYKGKWYPPLINNPNYKGKWKPAKIPNPDYYNDPEPFRMAPVGAVAIELWSMSSDIYFDNFLITESEDVANAWAADTFDLKVQKLYASDAGMFRRILNYSNRNPWLYAVYVVVVGLPLVLIVTFCCSGSSSSDSKAVEANGKKSMNHPKKTDEVQEDDDEEEEEEEEGEEEEEEEKEEPQPRRTSPRKRRPRKD